MDKQALKNPFEMRPKPFRIEKALKGHETLPDTPEAHRALEEARSEEDRFLAHYPSWKTFQEKKAPKKRPTGRLIPFHYRAWLAAAAALVLCFITARFVVKGERAPETLAGLTTKGGPWFSMLVAGHPALAGHEFPATPGDTVNLFLHNEKPLHYAVFYRDDGGPWELYFASPVEVPPTLRGAPLAHAITLAPGWRIEEIAAMAGTQPPGGAGRDCLPKAWNPGDLTASKATPRVGQSVPAHCREFTLNLFRLRNMQ